MEDKFSNYQPVTGEHFEASQFLLAVNQAEALLTYNNVVDANTEIERLKALFGTYFFSGNRAKIMAYGYLLPPLDRGAKDYDESQLVDIDITREPEILYTDSAFMLNLAIVETDDESRVVLIVRAKDTGKADYDVYAVRPAHLLQLEIAATFDISEELQDATITAQTVAHNTRQFARSRKEQEAQLTDMCAVIDRKLFSLYRGHIVSIDTDEFYCVSDDEEIDWGMGKTYQFGRAGTDRIDVSGEIIGVSLPELMSLSRSYDELIDFRLSQAVPHLLVRNHAAQCVYIVPFLALKTITTIQ